MAILNEYLFSVIHLVRNLEKEGLNRTAALWELKNVMQDAEWLARENKLPPGTIEDVLDGTLQDKICSLMFADLMVHELAMSVVQQYESWCSPEVSEHRPFCPNNARK